ncbi:MAG TPA: carboxypeptidase-like regulatory domain-containing protein [Longimicrobium sp.]|nr:carboxypeptidase-like regulatory domain-containing protein [Longimicrobium sp.]
MPAPFMNIRRLVPAAVLALVPAAAAAQANAASSIQITVRAEEGGAPVAGANVELMGAARAVNADSMGVARFRNVPPGPLLVQIRKLGFGTERFSVVVPARDTLAIEVDLQTEAVRLAEVRATARYNSSLRNTGFFERQASGLGSYATRQQWEGRGRLEFSDVVRRMRGVRVARTSDGRTVLLPSRPLASMSGCTTAQLYVDGVLTPFDPRHDDVNQLIGLAEIEAVEVYAGGAQAPAQYNATGSSCAVVLIWRKGER